MHTCSICSNHLESPFWVAPHKVAVSSVVQPSDHQVLLHYCAKCGHLQKKRPQKSAEYYDDNYNFYIDDDNSDQIYEIRKDRTVYRNEHQAHIFTKLFNLPPNAAVLDFGAAKGASLRHIQAVRPDIKPFAFEVSDVYVPFWKKWFGENSYACYTLPQEWTGKFDAIFSGFTHHHLDDPIAGTKELWRCLKPGGVVYFVVPDPLKNLGDIFVSDHPQHYTPSSATNLLKACGFDNIKVDLTSHFAGLIAWGTKVGDTPTSPQTRQTPDSTIETRARALCRYWEDYTAYMANMEKSDPDAVAIYGAFFYGTLLHAMRDRKDPVKCFVDRNSFYWREKRSGKPICGPEALPAEVRRVYFAVKPQIAKVVADEFRDLVHSDIEVILPPTPPDFLVT